ncbi:MAG: DUF494 family protein [Ignavibacteriae bacterium]|nr:DUF494 family protein [Ignavibacteriota bacterium]
MTAKIVEVLAKILEGLKKNYTIEEVTKKLKTNKDFDEQTVSAAFGLVFDKFLTNRLEIRKEGKLLNKGFRILSNDEINIVGTENTRYIQHLVNVGLLDPIDVELLIEQMTMFPEEKISKDDINWIILFSLVDFDSEILPGSRVLLYSSDTIN